MRGRNRYADRRLGRTRLAAQVEQVRAEGIDGYAWFPHEHSADALVTYAAGHGAKTIMLSRELEEPTFGSAFST